MVNVQLRVSWMSEYLSLGENPHKTKTTVPFLFLFFELSRPRAELHAIFFPAENGHPVPEIRARVVWRENGTCPEYLSPLS